jgi:long-chain acyl-CoA synthetase
LFGCWAAGLCAVPANARLHPREVEYIAENSGARLLIATPVLAEALAPLETSVASLERVIATRSPSYDAFLAAGEPLRSEPGTPTDRAWLFYTSGTTGRPKGAVLTHRNLLFASQCYYADIDQLDERDTHLLAAPVSHGAGLYGLPFLLKGAHQIVLPHFDVPAIIDVVQRHRQVSLFAAPTMLTRLVHAPEVAAAGLANLRTIYYGGGPMYVADLERALGIFGPRLYQLYGQGESPMTISYLPAWAHKDADDETLQSAGFVRSGVEVRIFDSAASLVPRGEIGEIAVRGDVVMEGYWRNEEANAASFAGRWLRTGDIGRFDARGRLHVLDRRHDMIISGGSNIYPREVEDVLIRHPAVKEAIVFGVPDAEWGENVVAAVVAREDQTGLDAETLIAFCRDHLASFKKPKQIEFLAELPKNAYGKVLRRKLRDSFESKRS